MEQQLVQAFLDAYCGQPPVPSGLWQRWTLDPWVLTALAAGLAASFRARNGMAGRAAGAAAVAVLLVAFVSPLCALSSALFSARIAHHLLLVAVAAPLIAVALAGALPGGGGRLPLTLLATAHAAVFWLWHAPGPYVWSLSHPAAYWLMELTLLATAVAFWRAALDPGRHAAGLLALVATMAHMGLLAAVLTFAGSPLYAPHLTTTQAWGLTPLQDQQVAGLLMWTAGAVPYIAAAVAMLGTRLRLADGEPA